eukprot:CAMPEP_0178443520 /NCGR_PEP_ID=MMETSP0689_2-20121128/38948_1 /TAXON_ID=160604 /ORGANISM="Amphidinium massartii, Strain CS-259" /LENGTH=310 /DNA_ID=CAMNT_0020067551 /DNA_START=33 /DNA_END=961 /DNA_ORIENTATION=+
MSNQGVNRPAGCLLSLGIGGSLACQFAFQPFLTRWYIHPSSNKSSVVLSCEVLKLAISAVILATSGRRKDAQVNWTLRGSLQAAGLPALTYTIQNFCNQHASHHLDGMTFNVINQSKVLFTAFFLYMLLGITQSMVQLVALMLIFLGSVCVSFGESGSLPTAHLKARNAEDFAYGLTCALMAAALSGLGSAIAELVLRHQRRDTFLFSAELATYSSAIILLNLVLDWNQDGTRLQRYGFFHLWTFATWLPVLTSALGGISVGMVTKILGSLRKGFAVTAGLILSAFLRWGTSNRPMTPLAITALPLVAVG